MRLLPLLLLIACAKSPRSLYLDELDSQTEMLLVSHNMGTALRLRGTYLSEGFRQTLAEERLRLTGTNDDDHARFLTRMADDGSAFHEVVFTAETAIVDAKASFGDNDDHWRVRLIADGVEESLVTVYKVRRPNTLHTQLYAHKSPYNELWIARFARTVAAPAEVRFHVGSGYGNKEITFSGDQLR